MKAKKMKIVAMVFMWGMFIYTLTQKEKLEDNIVASVVALSFLASIAGYLTYIWYFKK